MGNVIKWKWELTIANELIHNYIISTYKLSEDYFKI